MNFYLEDLSRQYLGGDADESLFLEYYYQHEEDDETSPAYMMRQNVPPELVNLELQDLQCYLEDCGVLAHTLVAQALNTRTLVDEEEIDEEKLNEQLDDIPSIFYDAEFDLTDAKTFAELLMVSEDNDDTKVEAKNSLYQPTQELFPVREQDFLAGHLDGVELALQEQVRQKSTAFFQETTKFRQLQSSIEDLLKQVQQLRSSMQFSLALLNMASNYGPRLLSYKPIRPASTLSRCAPTTMIELSSPVTLSAITLDDVMFSNSPEIMTLT